MAIFDIGVKNSPVFWCFIECAEIWIKNFALLHNHSEPGLRRTTVTLERLCSVSFEVLYCHLFRCGTPRRSVGSANDDQSVTVWYKIWHLPANHFIFKLSFWILVRHELNILVVKLCWSDAHWVFVTDSVNATFSIQNWCWDLFLICL